MSKKSPVGEPVEDYLKREMKKSALRTLHEVVKSFNAVMNKATSELDISLEVFTDGKNVTVKIDGRDSGEYEDA